MATRRSDRNGGIEGQGELGTHFSSTFSAQLNDHTQFLQLFQNSASQVKALIELRHTLLTARTEETPQSRAFVEILTKHIRHIGKFFRRLSQLSHVRFVELPGCGDLIMFYWDHVARAVAGPSENIQGLNVP